MPVSPRQSKMQTTSNNHYDGLLIPLDTYIREQEQTMADLLWSDPNDPVADQIQHRIDEARKLVQNGNAYWIGF